MPNRRRPRNTQPSTILNDFEQIAAREGLDRDMNPDEYWSRRREHISTEVRMRFSRLFGRDVDHLEGWQRLCVAVLGTTGKRGVKLEELNSIDACKKKLKHNFVNLIDLVEYTERKQPLPKNLVFHSRDALADYIREEEKFFSKDLAKEDPLLKHFLITV